MAISVRLNDKDTTLVKKYAEINNMSVSDFVRKAVMERIEDEIDLKAYDKAMAEYQKDPRTYSMEAVRQMLELDKDV